MTYISLGNNCFWGNVANELNLYNKNSSIFKISTSLLAIGGIYFYYNSKIKIYIPKLLSTYILLLLVFKKNIKTDNLIKYLRKLTNENILKFFAYKIFKYLIFPIFEFHYTDNIMKSKKYIEIISNYSEYPADVYIYGGKIKNNILNRFFIKKIYTFISKYNKNCVLLIFSPYKIIINCKNINCILINTNECYRKNNSMQFNIKKHEYDILCNIFNYKFKSITYF